MQISLNCIAVLLSRQDDAEAVLFDMRVIPVPEYAMYSGSVSMLEYVVSGLLRAMGRTPVLYSQSMHTYYPEEVGKPPDEKVLAKHLEHGKGSGCQLVAAIALSQLAALPDMQGLPNHNGVLNRGPFREILHRVGLLQHLLWLFTLQWDGRMRDKVNATVSYGMMVLVSPGQKLPLCVLRSIVSCFSTQMDQTLNHPKNLQLLCFSMWTLCQNSANANKLLAKAKGLDCAIRAVHQLFIIIDSWETKGSPFPNTVKEIAEGIEAAVLLLWCLLSRLIGKQHCASTSSSSYFVASPATWWELPANSK